MGPLFSTVYKSSQVSLKMFQGATWPGVLKSEMYKKRSKILLNGVTVSIPAKLMREQYTVQRATLWPSSCAWFCSSIQREDLESPAMFWHTHTHFIARFHLGFVVATQWGEQLFLWFLSGSATGWCTRSLTRNSALLGFPAWFCTQKQPKRFSWHSYWNLQMIFPTQIDLGTSAFHPLLFVTSYVLPVWYNLDIFLYGISLLWSAIVFC